MAGYDEARGRATYRTMLERLRALPGVEHASVASTVPFGDITEDANVHVGDRKAIGDLLDRRRRLLQDTRACRCSAAGSSRQTRKRRAIARRYVAVVDEPLARKLFADADPIGRQVQLGDADRGTERTLEIVGVAPGLRQEMFDPAPVPHVYVASGGSVSRPA